MIWGVIRTHVAVTKMMEEELSDSPIVTGNYAKWLVNNSGKKDALKLQKDLNRIDNSLSSLKDAAATKKGLEKLEAALATLKKTVDKGMGSRGTGGAN